VADDLDDLAQQVGGAHLIVDEEHLAQVARVLGQRPAAIEQICERSIRTRERSPERGTPGGAQEAPP
jgi:hypothetical protein